MGNQVSAHLPVHSNFGGLEHLVAAATVHPLWHDNSGIQAHRNRFAPARTEVIWPGTRPHE